MCVRVCVWELWCYDCSILIWGSLSLFRFREINQRIIDTQRPTVNNAQPLFNVCLDLSPVRRRGLCVCV